MNLDIIGDIHGCYVEFEKLTKKLGYDWITGLPVHPLGRHLAFVGDLTDRGPESIKTARLVWDLAANRKSAFYVPGNHCNKLYRYLLGNKVQTTHGLETTVSEFMSLNSEQKNEFRDKFIHLYESAPLYHVLDQGRLVIAHAGIREDYIGKDHSKVKTFVLYGDITGQTNPDGTPVRRDWAKNYQGKAIIVYGHTPVREPRVLNNTYNIDTGAVFGGNLTALRYPEMELVSVPSSMPLVREKFREIN
ncbi:bis(5'-nucleosyl)-tetraphosphatase PrpE [Mesobacillus selenatarsenatis]|uniref:Bis(5'-nucleosyl)-tetraphosphatase PrpE [asymmetrical] n=1 Tax=Mesobacillus selenatarsenatis (strain DSM 18680 / JCM 14380 / FERM P-15431 / SF-1) TaxID=1321606 RepID=A0A0A8XEL9_MESS1|nr:bis(5'-nucleosyl)-tetraphosphatase PrpE [Mesobacillus selenatarsenatis]GAM16596.1 diadenosine tetraphosphatase [Mesobacillus selenatarsenatis SF-1]